MFEDMLAYQPGALLKGSFAELLAADLDDDARDLFARMAADVETVSATAWPSYPGGLIRTVLTALAAVPDARPAAWRQLYVEIAALVGGCIPEAAPAEDRPSVVRALGRLRQFLAENADIADALAVEELERGMFGRGTGA